MMPIAGGAGEGEAAIGEFDVGLDASIRCAAACFAWRPPGDDSTMPFPSGDFGTASQRCRAEQDRSLSSIQRNLVEGTPSERKASAANGVECPGRVERAGGHVSPAVRLECICRVSRSEVR